MTFMHYFVEFLIGIRFDKMEAVRSGIHANTLHQLRGYTHSLYFRRNHNTKDRFYLNVPVIFVYWVIRA